MFETVGNALPGAAISLAAMATLGPKNLLVIRQSQTLPQARSSAYEKQGSDVSTTNLRAAVTTLIVCDVALICLGVGGAGTLIANMPLLAKVLTAGGVLFMVLVATQCAQQAWAKARSSVRPCAPMITGASGRRSTAVDHAAPSPSPSPSPSPRMTAGTAAGCALLNPQGLMEMLIMVGGASATITALPDKTWFAVGAIVATVAWYLALGLATRKLSDLLNRPAIWIAINLTGAAILLWVAYFLFTSIF